MQRLGKNISSYQGEGINIDHVLAEIAKLAVDAGWERDPISVSDSRTLPAFRRVVSNSRERIYISTGIHGDEPAGPLAVLKLFQQKHWPDNISLWLIPCLNPGGFLRNSRENEDGIDLNRDYRSLQTPVVRAHVQWLERQPAFTSSLLLHEDWESNGFYLYELNPKRLPSHSETMIKPAAQVCPIDRSSVIEGREAQDGIICANPDLLKRPDWPEAFYMVHYKSPVSYTLEAPSDFPLAVRVDALVAGVRGVLDVLERGG